MTTWAYFQLRNILINFFFTLNLIKAIINSKRILKSENSTLIVTLRVLMRAGPSSKLFRGDRADNLE